MKQTWSGLHSNSLVMELDICCDIELLSMAKKGTRLYY